MDPFSIGSPEWGLRVFTSRVLPIEPTPGQVARRIVRRGLAERLPWLAIDPGPSPQAATHAIFVGSTVHVSHALYDEMHEWAADGSPYPHPLAKHLPGRTP